MNALDLLRRERFMSLRGVKAARALLGRDPRRPDHGEAIRKVLVFLREFVVDLHFVHSEAVLRRWQELRGVPRDGETLPGVSAAHQRAITLLGAVEVNAKSLHEDAHDLTTSMTGLVDHLSEVLLACDDSFEAIEIEIDQVRESMLAELSVTESLDPELEARYAALLGELERSVR